MSRKRNNNGRDRSGRFVFGNRIGKGRKHDSENKTTADIRALRERIVASWDRCGGDKLLARIAKRTPRQAQALREKLVSEAAYRVPNWRHLIGLSTSYRFTRK